MKFETLKTIILIFLIVMSLFLTFGMWNYQPSVESLSNATPEDINLNGTQESIRTLVEPRHIIFHNENQHFGFGDRNEKEDFYQEIQNWILYDLETVSIDNENENHDMEFIFPVPLPMEIVDSLFTFHTTNMELPIWSFQRMTFTLDREMRIIRVEFFSIDNREKAIAVIQDRRNYEQFTTFLEEHEFNRLSHVELQTGDSVYLPEGTIELPRRTIAFSKLNPHDLVDVLFTDPSVVRQSNYSNRGTTFFTDSSQMSVEQDDSTVKYISPGAINEYREPLNVEDLLNISISDINSYNGWTDTYKLTHINTNENYIRYQMFFQGYPVFSPLTRIEQRWGQRLIEYNRPLFRSNNALNENLVELDSSSKVWNYVENNYNMEDVVDIEIGYHLEYEKDENIIVLEPSWFIKQQFSRNWIPIQP